MIYSYWFIGLLDIGYWFTTEAIQDLHNIGTIDTLLFVVMFCIYWSQVTHIKNPEALKNKLRNKELHSFFIFFVLQIVDKVALPF